MIKTFKCKETEKLFNSKFSSKLPQNIQRTAQRKLILIHAATTLDFLRVPPANRLELLDANNTVLELMNNGVFVFIGLKIMLLMLK